MSTATATAVALGVLTYHFLYVNEIELRKPYRSSDKIAIDLAISEFGKETGATAGEINKGRFPVVIRFGGVRCVALQVPRHTLGRVPVYCFDMNYHRVHTANPDDPEIVDVR